MSSDKNYLLKFIFGGISRLNMLRYNLIKFYVKNRKNQNRPFVLILLEMVRNQDRLKKSSQLKEISSDLEWSLRRTGANSARGLWRLTNKSHDRFNSRHVQPRSRCRTWLGAIPDAIAILSLWSRLRWPWPIRH